MATKFLTALESALSRLADYVLGPIATNRCRPTIEYVCLAESIRFDGSTMKLSGMNASVACFKGRSEGESGSVSLTVFLQIWAVSVECFEADPPIALVAVEGQLDRPVIIELSNPSGAAGEYVFDVKILFGELPETAGQSFLIMEGGWPCDLHDALLD